MWENVTKTFIHSFIHSPHIQPPVSEAPVHISSIHWWRLWHDVKNSFKSNDWNICLLCQIYPSLHCNNTISWSVYFTAVWFTVFTTYTVLKVCLNASSPEMSIFFVCDAVTAKYFVIFKKMLNFLLFTRHVGFPPVKEQTQTESKNKIHFTGYWVNHFWKPVTLFSQSL